MEWQGENFKNLWKLQHNENENMFMFDEIFYRQKDRVVIGSPLGPVLSNIFLCLYENYGKNNVLYHLNHTFTWSIELFQECMKSRQTNIKFITDAEKDNLLAFLNINIMKHGESFLKGT